MNPPEYLLDVAPPSETALLDWSAAQVSRDMIHEICLHDYERDIEIHETALLKQLAPNPELGLLQWHPLEVLELERWEEPDKSWNSRPPTGIPGHLKRLFACAILLRNVAYVPRGDGESEFFVAKSGATVLQLLRSCVALGGQTPKLGIGFLLWLHNKQSHPVLRLFVAFAALMLQIQAGNFANLDETCSWVQEDEKLAREELEAIEGVHSAKWLVGLNYQEDSQEQPKLWTEVLAQAIAAGSSALPTEVRLTLEKMRQSLVQ